MRKGRLCLFFSAFLYGVIPIFTSVAYRGGVNGITMTFLRSSLSLPLLFVMIKADKKSMHLTRKQLRSILNLSVFGCALPILLLYLSYNYISTGLATTLHFVYPLVVVLASAVLYRQKLSRHTLCSVLFVTIGIFMFSDISVRASKIGIVLAILSGIFYSFYVIYIDMSGLDRMDYIVLTFYTMAVTSVVVLPFGLITGAITFDISPMSWSFAVLTSLAVTLGAMPLLQIGIRYEGAETAGILSAVEPITTVILGALFLGEIIGMGQIMGGVLILMGVLLSQKQNSKSVTR